MDSFVGTEDGAASWCILVCLGVYWCVLVCLGDLGVVFCVLENVLCVVWCFRERGVFCSLFFQGT